MRVLMTADTVGGVWTCALELIRGLAARGIETALATMGAPLTSDQWSAASAVPGVQIFESTFKLEWMDDPWANVFRAGDWLLELERRLSPDLVHLNAYAHGALPWRAPTIVAGHSCVLSWWRAVHREDAPPAWEMYREKITRGLRNADLVIAPSRAMLVALDEHYGPLPRAEVIYNGLNPSLFPPAPKEEFVISAGRMWDEGKNLRALAATAHRLPWPVFVAGDAKAEEGPSACRMLGRLTPEVLRSWMARAGIYALPALYEPFGLSILEAALSGCALVLGDIPSLRELWDNAAVFVPPDSPDALNSALMQLIADGECRKSMARRARQRALEFSAERMAGKYIAAYRSLSGIQKLAAAHSVVVRLPVH